MSIAVTVFYFTHFSCKGLDCFVFSSVCDFYYFKKGFQWDHRKECIDCSVPRQKAIHAEEYQYRGRTNKVKTLGERNESERTVCVALLLQCGLGCRLCQALYPSLYAHSLTPSASSSQRTCHTHTHTTHTHKILCTAVHTSSYKF